MAGFFFGSLVIGLLPWRSGMASILRDISVPA